MTDQFFSLAHDVTLAASQAASLTDHYSKCGKKLMRLGSSLFLFNKRIFRLLSVVRGQFHCSLLLVLAAPGPESPIHTDFTTTLNEEECQFFRVISENPTLTSVKTAALKSFTTSGRIT